MSRGWANVRAIDHAGRSVVLRVFEEIPPYWKRYREVEQLWPDGRATGYMELAGVDLFYLEVRTVPIGPLDLVYRWQSNDRR